MQVWLALLALVAIVTSPLMAAEEVLDAPQTEFAPSINDVAAPQPAEAAAPQVENTTDPRDVETAPSSDAMISVGPEGYPQQTQPN